MNLQVLPLKILATRQVVMDRMDYSTYVTGMTKLELDRLDILVGDFRLQDSKLTIEALYNGQRLPSDDWQYLKSCFKLPTALISFIEDTHEFRIVELKDGPRDWAMRYANASWKHRMLINRGKFKFSRTGWGHSEDFIEDGKVVNVTRTYKLDNGKTILTLDFRDSITTDKENNLIWNLMWSAPHRDVKITVVRVFKALGCRGKNCRESHFWRQCRNYVPICAVPASPPIPTEGQT